MLVRRQHIFVLNEAAGVLPRRNVQNEYVLPSDKHL